MQVHASIVSTVLDCLALSRHPLFEWRHERGGCQVPLLGHLHELGILRSDRTGIVCAFHETGLNDSLQENIFDIKV